MRILIDIPDTDESKVLALLHELGYDAHTQADDLLDAITESHLAEIAEREKDAILSQTHSLAAVKAEYVGKGL